MFNKILMSRMPQLILTLSAISILSACGGQAYKNDNTTDVYSPNNVAPTATPTPTATATPTPSTTPTTGNGTTDSDTSLGYSVVDTTFSVLGTKGISGTPSGNHIFKITDIATDNALNLRFTGDGNPGTVPDSGYQIAYKCIKFQVDIREQSSSGSTAASTKTVFLSNVGADISSGTCSGAKSIVQIGYIPPVGHGLLEVTITPKTFDNCNQQYDPFYGMGAYWASGCPLNIVPKEYLLSAYVEAFVNGTKAQ
jgi:hypothetical protein